MVVFHYGQALYRKLQELGLGSNRQSDHDAIMKWFRLFFGVAFVPSAQVIDRQHSFHIFHAKQLCCPKNELLPGF